MNNNTRSYTHTHTHNVIQFEGSLYGKENLIFATRIITSRGSWRSPQIAKIAVTFDTWGAGGGDASVKADWKSRESLLVSSFSIELKSFESFSIWRWVAGNLAKGTLHLHLPTFGNKIVHFFGWDFQNCMCAAQTGCNFQQRLSHSCWHSHKCLEKGWKQCKQLKTGICRRTYLCSDQWSGRVIIEYWSASTSVAVNLNLSFLLSSRFEAILY